MYMKILKKQQTVDRNWFTLRISSVL